ncbi:hypothetical protein Dimus_017982 [Dionaea muscipula]
MLVELHTAVRWTTSGYVIGLTFGLFARRWMLLHAGLTAVDSWATSVGLLELHATLQAGREAAACCCALSFTITDFLLLGVTKPEYIFTPPSVTKPEHIFTLPGVAKLEQIFSLPRVTRPEQIITLPGVTKPEQIFTLPDVTEPEQIFTPPGLTKPEQIFNRLRL